MKQTDEMKAEVGIIKQIRALFPKTPRRKLARQIAEGDFDTTTEAGQKAKDIRGYFYRSELSVYSVLRRAEAPKGGKLSGAVKKALAKV